MGNGIPSDKRPLSAVEALAREHPTQLMARLRAVWPHVQQALKAGHTLRLIHERLNMAGVPISYKVLVVYRYGRIERGESQLRQPASQTAAKVAQIVAEPAKPSEDRSPSVRSILAWSICGRRNRNGWAGNIRQGPPDESKLF